MTTRCLVSLVLLLGASPLTAQLMPRQPLPPESERDSAWYVVSGYRHGVSYFPRVRHPEVQYEPGDALTFDRYHSVDVVYAWVRKYARQYPNLVDVYEVGRSFEGRAILQVTLTNKATGSDLDKPAAYFEGGRHAGEVTGTESVMWLMRHLLTSYGKDPAITHLLDTKALYLRPENDPDGANMYLHTAQRSRSTVRPYDDDRDGLLDEDPPEDLDGDGVIYQLRWKPGKDSPVQARYVLDERDASGRLLRRAKPGEKAVWAVISEGVDNDGDGQFNEDGVGGLDLHRNYVENWRPDRGMDATERGYTQGGAGPYPLSEPETRAVVLWLLQHPHVSVVNTMDTRVPMHLRPPSTSFSADRMYPEDLALYEHFDSLGLSITHYPWAGDVYDTYATRYPVSPWSGEPSEPSPLFGHSPDFGYFYFGAIWYGDELWNGGAMEDVNGDSLLDDVDALAWDDGDNGGRGFREWAPFHHPTLGDVEIGGFKPKFFSQNGPPQVLEEWIRKEALFNLAMAEHLPQLEIDAVSARRVEADGDSATYDVTVRWTNVGKLPTALHQAQLVKIVRPDRVVLRFGDAPAAARDRRGRPAAEEDSQGAGQPRILDPAGRDKTIKAGWTEAGESKTVTFRVRTYGREPVTATVELLSTRGGKVTRTVQLR